MTSNNIAALSIATRNSKLALWQAEWILSRLQQHIPQNHYKLLPMVSTGDIKLQTRLARVGGKGLFTIELEEALLERRAVVAVHSLKDVPMTVAPEFELAYTSRGNVADVAIFPHNSKYRKLEDLPAGSIVGTSSVRRQAMLAHYFPTLKVKILRGNVQTRLEKLNDPAQGYDAILLAQAGLERLEIINSLPIQILNPNMWVPAPGQGIIALQYLKGSEFIYTISSLENTVGTLCTLIERGIAKQLGGSCSLPLGVYVSFITKDNIEVSSHDVSVYEETAFDHKYKDEFSIPIVKKFNLSHLCIRIFMSDLLNTHTIKQHHVICLDDIGFDQHLNLTLPIKQQLQALTTQIVTQIYQDGADKILTQLEQQIDQLT